MSIANAVVFAHAMSAVVFSTWYFRRYRITRPPIGVFNLADLAVMLVGIVVVPYLYLLLPRTVVVALLTLGALSVVYVALEPVVRIRSLVWLITLAIVAADLLARFAWGAQTTPLLVINNLLLVVMVVGITNLWAQSGMQARTVTLLGLALVLYDVVVTWLIGQTSDLFREMLTMPFAPVLMWHLPDGRWLGLGLGDVLLAAVFPLVLHKAFGHTAGRMALAIAVATLGLVVFAPLVVEFRTAFPVMIVLGPVMLGQYAYWQRRCGWERTTWQYLQAEPLARVALGK